MTRSRRSDGEGVGRKVAAATRLWQCYHCGFIATNDEEAKEHFGRNEGDQPSCLQAAEAALAEAREAASNACAQLDKAADQFAFYADEHAKKGTKDGDTKGMVNHQWALACARVAHEVKGIAGVPQAELDKERPE